jgi:Na+/glutamate symporter
MQMLGLDACMIGTIDGNMVGTEITRYMKHKKKKEKRKKEKRKKERFERGK